MIQSIKSLRNYSGFVLTGGSSGLGESILHLLLRIDTKPLICNLSRTPPKVDMSAYSQLKHYPCDLSDMDPLKEKITFILEALSSTSLKGPILLINNAGFGAMGEYPAGDVETHLNMVDLNVKAPMLLIDRLLPLLKAQGGGIINVASKAAFQAMPYMSTYAATKAFLLHHGLALHEELKAFDIQVLSACPGPVHTNFFKRLGLAKRVLPSSIGQQPDEVVAEIFKAYEAKKSFVVTGKMNKCIAAISSKVPKNLSTAVAGRIMRKVLN